MAIDPNILLQVRTPNALQAIAGGMQVGQDFQNNKLAQLLNQQKIESNKMQMDEAKAQAPARKQAAFTANQEQRYKSMWYGLNELAGASPDRWEGILTDRIAQKQRFGMDDVEDEQEALDILRKGGPEALQKEIQGGIQKLTPLFGKKSNYGRLESAIGADGKPVFIQTSDSGGVSEVKGYRPMPTAAEQQAQIAAQQNQALANLYTNLNQPGGAAPNGPVPPPPGAPAIPPEQLAQLPQSTLTDLVKTATDPKTREEARNAQIAKAQETTKGANSFELIDSVLTDPALWASTGLTGIVYRNIPGTQGKRVNANIERLKGETFLQSIQAIKGLGALSNAEGDKLQAAAAAIDPQMDEPDLRNELVRLRGQVSEGIRNTWVVDNPGIPAEDIDMLIERPDLAPRFKEMYGRLPKGYERVQKYFAGPQSKDSPLGGGQIKFMGFE